MLELHDESPSYSHESPHKNIFPIPPSGSSQSLQRDGEHYGHLADNFHDQFQEGNGTEYHHEEVDHNYGPLALSPET